MMRMNISQRDSGFTLIELLIVVSIVAILAAIAIPSFNKYIFDAQEAEGTRMLLEAHRDMQRVTMECQAAPERCASNYTSNGKYTEALESSDPTIPILMYRPASHKPRFNLITGNHMTKLGTATIKFSLDQLGYDVPQALNSFGIDNNGGYLIGVEGQLNGANHVLAINENGVLFKLCDAWTGAVNDDVYYNATGEQANCGSDSGTDDGMGN